MASNTPGQRKRMPGPRRKEPEFSNNVPLREVAANECPEQDPVRSDEHRNLGNGSPPVHKQLDAKSSSDYEDADSYYQQISSNGEDPHGQLNPGFAETCFDDDDDHEVPINKNNDDDPEFPVMSGARLLAMRITLIMLSVMIFVAVFLALSQYFGIVSCKLEQITAGNLTIAKLEKRMNEINRLNSRMMIAPQNNLSYLERLHALEKKTFLQNQLIGQATNTAILNFTSEVPNLELSYAQKNEKLNSTLHMAFADTLIRLWVGYERSKTQIADTGLNVSSMLQRVNMKPGPQGEQGPWGIGSLTGCRKVSKYLRGIKSGKVHRIQHDVSSADAVVGSYCASNTAVPVRHLASTANQICEFYFRGVYKPNDGSTCSSVITLCKKVIK